MTSFLQDILDIHALLLSHSAGGKETGSLSAKRNTRTKGHVFRNTAYITLEAEARMSGTVACSKKPRGKKCNFGCFVASQGHVSWFRLQGLAAGTVRLFYHNRPCSPSVLF